LFLLLLVVTTSNISCAIDDNCRNFKLRLTTKAKGWKVTGQERDSGVTSHVFKSAKSVSEWTFTLSSELPCWELESQMVSQISRTQLRGQNSSPWKVLYIIGKLLKCKCLKWVHITHLDIWSTSYGQKKGRELNLPIWLLPTKSRELTQFPCVQKTCNILLENSWQGLQLCLRPYCNQRFALEVMCLLSPGSPYEFQDSHLGVPRQKGIWMWAPWRAAQYTIRGKVVVSPQVWVMVNLVCPSCLWFVLRPKVLQLCTNHFILILCRSVWIIEAC
jgi:hypothetical protein